MSQLASDIVDLLKQADVSKSLNQLARGIEKESLRIQSNGHLVQTAHPESLGSALKHGEITTDYSEALLELITPTYSSIEGCLTHLDDIHRFVYSQLEGESLWPASMPCILGKDKDIPVAQYGSSNVGQMKTVYRLGLGHRYGRLMQTIAGVHYNVSLPDSFWKIYQSHCASTASLQDFKTEQYFHLIRNFRRHVWLLIYLFGASPAVCKSFVNGRKHKLQSFNNHTLSLPYATALRMGNLGYQSSAQDELYVSYNSLQEYSNCLLGALLDPHPVYENIGVKVDGKYRQLSNALLQIENEFYSVIRPKRTANSGETPINALNKRGVEYIEVRCLDVSPYLPLGVEAEQLRFIDVFLLYCLLSTSPPLTPAEENLARENQTLVVEQGRKPDLTLHTLSGEKPLFELAQSMLHTMQGISSCLDREQKSGERTQPHQDAVKAQLNKLQHPKNLPSALIMQELKQNDISYMQFVLSQAEKHHLYFQQKPLSSKAQKRYEQAALLSLKEQALLEQQEQISFDDYLAEYYRQYQRKI